jgi:hypothetical protein
MWEEEEEEEEVGINIMFANLSIQLFYGQVNGRGAEWTQFGLRPHYTQ